MPAITVGLAALPSLIILGVLYWLDQFEREPMRMVFRAFILGSTALPMVFFINAVLPGIPASSGVVNSIFVAPFTEEIYKFAAFMLAVYWTRNHDEPIDAIVYYVACGVGFGVAENFTFIVSGMISNPAILWEPVETWFSIAGIRSFPGHALFGAIGGWFAGRSRLEYGSKRVLWLMGALGASIVVHALFNMIASLGLLLLLVLFSMGLAMFAFILASDALDRSPRNPASDALNLDERIDEWVEEGYDEAGPLVFTAYFVGSLLLIFLFAYTTIWVLTFIE